MLVSDQIKALLTFIMIILEVLDNMVHKTLYIIANFSDCTGTHQIIHEIPESKISISSTDMMMMGIVLIALHTV